MGEIHVQFESLETGASGIRNNYSKLTAAIDQLETDLQPMISSWSGAAQESFLACQQQWNEGAQSLATVLNTVSRAVGEAHTNYSTTHNATIQIWT